MKHWKMTAADFYTLLTTVQGYRCALTGRELRPQNTSIVHCVPLSKGGRHCIANVRLVRTEFASLARKHSLEEVLSMCKEILDFNSSRPHRRPLKRSVDKADWQVLLFRMATFNQKPEATELGASRRKPTTWGSTSGQEIMRLNRAGNRAK